MKEYRDIFSWEAPSNGCAVTLGRFDGVHLGHRALLERAVEHAGMHKLTPVCFSFQEKTYPGAETRGVLTTEDEKAEILASIGIEVLLHPRFEPPLIKTTAQDFVRKYLFDRWKAKLIVVGYDFHFGANRLGDTSMLLSEGEKFNVEVEIFKAYHVNGEVVKASRIRELVSEGKIESGNALLGRPFSVRVKSEKGRGLGKKLGFPTINFPWPELKVRPPHGIYAVKIESENLAKLNGVANFGTQPTIDPANVKPVLEVHILGELPKQFDSDLNRIKGLNYNVEIHSFLRKESKFNSVNELTTQIGKDCDAARIYLNQMST